jgi:hypothetical protein
MNTTYLRFPSQDVWKQAATAVGVLSVVDGEEQWSYYTHDWAVDDVGVIYNDDGVYSDDGEVITPPTPMDGWHVNYKAATLPSDLEAYVVTPNSPNRKFAGE